MGVATFWSVWWAGRGAAGVLAPPVVRFGKLCLRRPPCSHDTQAGENTEARCAAEGEDLWEEAWC